MAVALPDLPRGTYRVAWKTLSADDMHQASGVLAFGIGEHGRRGGHGRRGPGPRRGRHPLGDVVVPGRPARPPGRRGARRGHAARAAAAPLVRLARLSGGVLRGCRRGAAGRSAAVAAPGVARRARAGHRRRRGRLRVAGAVLALALVGRAVSQLAERGPRPTLRRYPGETALLVPPCSPCRSSRACAGTSGRRRTCWSSPTSCTWWRPRRGSEPSSRSRWCTQAAGAASGGAGARVRAAVGHLRRRRGRHRASCWPGTASPRRPRWCTRATASPSSSRARSSASCCCWRCSTTCRAAVTASSGRPDGAGSPPRRRCSWACWPQRVCWRRPRPRTRRSGRRARPESRSVAMHADDLLVQVSIGPERRRAGVRQHQRAADAAARTCTGAHGASHVAPQRCRRRSRGVAAAAARRHVGAAAAGAGGRVRGGSRSRRSARGCRWRRLAAPGSWRAASTARTGSGLRRLTTPAAALVAVAWLAVLLFLAARCGPSSRSVAGARLRSRAPPGLGVRPGGHDQPPTHRGRTGRRRRLCPRTAPEVPAPPAIVATPGEPVAPSTRHPPGPTAP